MMVIGIDPGLTGALCLLDSQRGLLECADIPTCANGQATGSMRKWLDVWALLLLLAEWRTRHDMEREDVHAAIERPVPMPTLPAQTIASQFDTFGALRGVLSMRLDSNRIRVVTPQEWKKLYGIGHDKDRARSVAQALYGNAPVARVKDHNRAESILIGHWLVSEVA